MRTMSCLLSILVLLCGLAQVEAQAPMPTTGRFDDNYAVPYVTWVFNFMHRTNVNSIEMKQLWRLAELGDGASIATLKIYDKDDLIKPENAANYLVVVRNAFSDKNHVLNKSDSGPKVTLFLLSYLEEKETTEPLIEKSITYLKRCVADFSCSSQAEYDFVHEPPRK